MEDLDSFISIPQLERDFDDNTICAANRQSDLTDHTLIVPNFQRDSTPSASFIELNPYEEKRTKYKPFKMNKNCFISAAKQLQTRNKRIEVIFIIN